MNPILQAYDCVLETQLYFLNDVLCQALHMGRKLQ